MPSAGNQHAVKSIILGVPVYRQAWQLTAKAGGIFSHVVLLLSCCLATSEDSRKPLSATLDSYKQKILNGLFYLFILEHKFRELACLLSEQMYCSEAEVKLNGILP